MTKRKAKLKLVEDAAPEPEKKKHKLSLEERVDRLERVIHASTPLPDYD